MKQFFIYTLLLVSLSAISQTEKGAIFLGGNSSFSFSSGESNSEADNFERNPTKYIGFGISPKAGYFIIDNLAVGSLVQFSTSKSTREDENGNDAINRSTGYSLGPFVRYYFSEGAIRPYAQTEVGFGNSKSKSEQIDNEFTNKNSTFYYGVDGGLAFFINDKVALNAAASYRHRESKNKDRPENYKSISDRFALSVGFDVFL